MRTFEVGEKVMVVVKYWFGEGVVTKKFLTGSYQVKMLSGSQIDATGAFAPDDLRKVEPTVVEKLEYELSNFNLNTDSANRKVIAAMAAVVLELGKKSL